MPGNLPLGTRDSRGMQGIFSRGKNVYNGGTSAAHSGGGSQFGRPKVSPPKKPSVPGVLTQDPSTNPYMEAIRRRLMRGHRGSHS